MDTRHEEPVRSQAIVELTEANLTPAEDTPEWEQETTYLQAETPAIEPSPSPLAQDMAKDLAISG